MIIRCTYQDWRRNSHTGDKQCTQTATIFYRLREGAVLNFQAGGEGDRHGGYLARCPSHETDNKRDFEVIGVHEYIVGTVMET